MQIGNVDNIVVYNTNASDAGTSEIGGYRRTKSADTYYQYLSLSYLTLTLLANFGEHHLTIVTIVHFLYFSLRRSCVSLAAQKLGPHIVQYSPSV